MKQCYEKSRNLDIPKLLKKNALMQKLYAKIALSIFVSIYSQFLYVLELKKTENKAKRQ